MSQIKMLYTKRFSKKIEKHIKRGYQYCHKPSCFVPETCPKHCPTCNDVAERKLDLHTAIAWEISLKIENIYEYKVNNVSNSLHIRKQLKHIHELCESYFNIVDYHYEKYSKLQKFLEDSESLINKWLDRIDKLYVP